VQVIVRRDGRIQLLCKGADSTVYERLGSDSADMMELTTSNLNVRITAYLLNASAYFCSWHQQSSLLSYEKSFGRQKSAILNRNSLINSFLHFLKLSG